MSKASKVSKVRLLRQYENKKINGKKVLAAFSIKGDDLYEDGETNRKTLVVFTAAMRIINSGKNNAS